MANVILIILDSVGIGALPDAKKYGDEGASTLKNLLGSIENVNLPNLERLGLGKISPLNGISSKIHAIGAYGKLSSKTFGKDTTVGHWELMGLPLKSQLKTFKNGIPKEIIEEFENISNHKVIGGMPASGTEIIKNLGEEHEKTKKLIVYTSADSVFQIAANENIVPIKELYLACEKARTICDKHNIARVIARPYIIENGNRIRTKNRKDFSMVPPNKTALNFLYESGIKTIGIGKIDDIFAGSGLAKKIHSKGNNACINETLFSMEKEENSFIFTNLVDFDMLYGHRRDPFGYYNCIKEFDNSIPEIISNMTDDLLIISADHGNDPTHIGTDHTREYVPVLVYSKKMTSNLDLGTGETFANIGKTILDYFKVKGDIEGKSFLKKLGLK